MGDNIKGATIDLLLDGVKKKLIMLRKIINGRNCL